MTEQEKRNIVERYVFQKRSERGIVPDDSFPHEPSCEEYGEFRNLIEVKLMQTNRFEGVWDQLLDPEVLEGAYRYVEEGRNR